MKIALAFLPSWLPYTPPLGIATVSAFLKKHGHEVSLYDLNAEIHSKLPSSQQKYWQMENAQDWMVVDRYKELIHPLISSDLIQYAKEIALQNYDALGLSIYSSNYFPSRSLVNLIKKLNPSIKIFFGGPGIDEALICKDMEEGLIDGAVFGEGELGVLDILDYFIGKKKLDDCKGIMVFSPQGDIAKLPAHKLLKMKDLPLPDFSSFDQSLYFDKTMAIEFSRGCIANCTFCSETNYWVSFRTKSVEQIVAEFRYNVKTYGVHHFRVVDSLMNGNMRFLKELAQEIIEANIEIYWHGFCRIDPKLDDEALDLMYRAGCRGIIFGLETGSQKVLNLMNKKVNLKDQYEVVRKTNKHGISVYSEILVGFPGESLYDFFLTMKMLWVLRREITGVNTGSTMSVVKNSEVYDKPEKFGVIKSVNGWRTEKGFNNPTTRKILFSIMNRWVKLLRFEC